MPLTLFSFIKLSHKADWSFLLSVCTKCNAGVVGMKHELTYRSYSLNGYSKEEYELGWINPLLADSMPPAIGDSNWNKEKDWWLVAVPLFFSKERQLLVLQKVPGGSVINHKKTGNNLNDQWEENGKTNCHWFKQQDITKQQKWRNYSNMQQCKWMLVI